jgi:hypothetical protein
MALRRLLQCSVLPRMTARSVGASFSTETAETIRATLFPGDGIGPEIAESVKQVRNSFLVYAGVYLCGMNSDHSSMSLCYLVRSIVFVI